MLVERRRRHSLRASPWICTVCFSILCRRHVLKSLLLSGNLELILQILNLKDSYLSKYLYRLKMSETYLTRTLSTYKTKKTEYNLLHYCSTMIVEEPCLCLVGKKKEVLLSEKILILLLLQLGSGFFCSIPTRSVSSVLLTPLWNCSGNVPITWILVLYWTTQSVAIRQHSSCDLLLACIHIIKQVTLAYGKVFFLFFFLTWIKRNRGKSLNLIQSIFFRQSNKQTSGVSQSVTCNSLLFAQWKYFFEWWGLI